MAAEANAFHKLDAEIREFGQQVAPAKLGVGATRGRSLSRDEGIPAKIQAKGQAIQATFTNVLKQVQDSGDTEKIPELKRLQQNFNTIIDSLEKTPVKEKAEKPKQTFLSRVFGKEKAAPPEQAPVSYTQLKIATNLDETEEQMEQMAFEKTQKQYAADQNADVKGRAAFRDAKDTFETLVKDVKERFPGHVDAFDEIEVPQKFERHMDVDSVFREAMGKIEAEVEKIKESLVEKDLAGQLSAAKDGAKEPLTHIETELQTLRTKAETDELGKGVKLRYLTSIQSEVEFIKSELELLQPSDENASGRAENYVARLNELVLTTNNFEANTNKELYNGVAYQLQPILQENEKLRQKLDQLASLPAAKQTEGFQELLNEVESIATTYQVAENLEPTSKDIAAIRKSITLCRTRLDKALETFKEVSEKVGKKHIETRFAELGKSVEGLNTNKELNTKLNASLQKNLDTQNAKLEAIASIEGGGDISVATKALDRLAKAKDKLAAQYKTLQKTQDSITSLNGKITQDSDKSLDEGITEEGFGSRMLRQTINMHESQVQSLLQKLERSGVNGLSQADIASLTTAQEGLEHIRKNFSDITSFNSFENDRQLVGRNINSKAFSEDMIAKLDKFKTNINCEYVQTLLQTICSEYNQGYDLSKMLSSGEGMVNWNERLSAHLEYMETMLKACVKDIPINEAVKIKKAVQKILKDNFSEVYAAHSELNERFLNLFS